MKKILTIFCWIVAFYAVWFPFSYFGKDIDKMEVRLSHILVDTQEEANNIKQQIEQGKKFEDLADKYSKELRSKGGDIGYAQRNRYDKNVEKAAFTLNKGEISEPVQSKHGWHLVKVTNIRYYSDSENFKYNPKRYIELL